MKDSVSIVWFRLDLRLTDNRALLAATGKSIHVVPLYIWSPSEECDWAPGAASRWWLHQSLQALSKDLRKHGSQLVIRSGKSLDVLQGLIKETGARSVFWNRRYEPVSWTRDQDIQAILEAYGVNVETYNSSLFYEPELVKNREGNPFRVFTPFWNYCSAQLGEPSYPAKKPKSIPFPDKHIVSLPLQTLELEPRLDWASGMKQFWTPGEYGAQLRLQQFIDYPIGQYATGRDRPDLNGVSMLSPHLHFGEVGPHQIWHSVKGLDAADSAHQSIVTYLKELGWREFAYHILFHFPRTAEHPMRKQFESFPWSDNRSLLKHWQKGETGYPIVDAGMRQLWYTGWMHNRVRMIVASFLTKDLLISWTHGAKWFWDTLVDADLASNTLGWQWAAGCGADAAPYFRIFNPELQGEKFDPDGEYVKRWVPELAQLPSRWIHKPWKAPVDVLKSAGVVLGRTYPKPMVDHGLARKQALEALATTNGVSDAATPAITLNY